MDFAAQELRVIADYSQDENMLACFVGDNKKDMHLLTALGILRQMDEYRGLTYAGSEILRQADAGRGLTYAGLVAGYEDRNSPDYSNFKDARTLGKKTNFTSEYGAMAPKLAQTLLVSEEIAQGYLDAREEAFPQAKAWKEGVIADAKAAGVVRTKMGAVRHLADAFMSSDRQTSSRAERQSVNFKVQSSSAEMTKLALGAMYRANLIARFDCQFYFPVHDEVVWSCTIEDLEGFIPAAHECMVRAYADMSVPIISSIAFGKSFGPSDQIEIGEEPTAKAVQEGLAKMRVQSALAA